MDIGSTYHLNATDIRGTISRYNAPVGDEAYWNQTYDITQLDKISLANGYHFVMLQQGVATSNTPREWNGFCSLVGAMIAGAGDIPDGSDVPCQNAIKFVRTRAMRFDIKRHRCSGTWKITRSSIELEEGRCDSVPLEDQYQVYDNSQLSLSAHLLTSLSEYLGGFSTGRNQSHWRVPTHAAAMALAYHSFVAANEGYVPVQVNGPLWLAQNTVSWFNETYRSTKSIRKSIPTLRDSPSLYLNRP
jgi:hypothetical protein